jgi:hypothetical protein
VGRFQIKKTKIGNFFEFEIFQKIGTKGFLIFKTKKIKNCGLKKKFKKLPNNGDMTRCV